VLTAGARQSGGTVRIETPLGPKEGDQDHPLPPARSGASGAESLAGEAHRTIHWALPKGLVLVVDDDPVSGEAVGSLESRAHGRIAAEERVGPLWIFSIRDVPVVD